MNTETFSKTAFGRVFVKILASGMESRFRYKFFSPLKVLKNADIKSGQDVLEIGCGTGFFTIPATGLIGEKGSLTSIDILQESADLVSAKVQKACLKNVTVKKANAADTGFDAESFHTVLLFGVIPAPMLPLNILLPEIHRVLKPEGTLSVWPPIPGWLPQSVLKQGLFTLKNKHNNVYNFQRC